MTASFVPPFILLAPCDDDAKSVLGTAADILDQFGVAWKWVQLGDEARAGNRKARAIVAASPDGELPGRWSRAARVLTLRVPVEGGNRAGVELLDDGSGQLPAGPEDGVFATMAIGVAGARNAALFIVAVLAVRDEALRERWSLFRERQTADVLAGPALTLGD